MARKAKIGTTDFLKLMAWIDEVETMKSEVKTIGASQGKEITHLTTELQSANKRIERMEARLGKIEPHKVERYLTKIQGRVESIHDESIAVQLKLTVVAAIASIGRTKGDKQGPRTASGGFDVSACLLEVIDCFKESNQWWVERQVWDVSQWVEEMGKRSQWIESGPPRHMPVVNRNT